MNDLFAFVYVNDNISKPQKLLNQMPENVITDVFDFHYFYVNFRKDYVKSTLTNEYINSFLNMTVLFLSNCKITSNPYLKAKLVEILYFFFQSDKSRVNGALTANELAMRNITSCKQALLNYWSTDLLYFCTFFLYSAGEVLHWYRVHRRFDVVLFKI